MKFFSIYFLLVITYWVLRYFFHEGHEFHFAIVRLVFFGFVGFKLVKFLRARPADEDMSRTLQKFIEQRFGRAFGGYLIYEVKLLIGVLRFLASPIKTSKGITSSYFANAYLNGLLLFVCLMLVLEPIAIHLLVSHSLSAGPAAIAHVVLIILELWCIELLAGNLFYVQFSKVEIGEEAAHIQLGLIWNLRFRISDVASIELLGLEPQRPKIPKIALENQPNIRVHFKEEQLAERMIGTKPIRIIDLFLKEADRQALIERCQQCAAS